MDALSPAQILRGAVACAIQAPSSHNTQPWRFRRRGDVLELRADRDRHLDVIDPLRRQITISCGCALYNARVALRASGYVGQVDLMPDRDRPDLMALIGLGLKRTATADDLDLLAAISRRHTNRRPFFARPVGQAEAEHLARAAAAERTKMIRLTPDQKRELAGLVAESDRRRFSEPAYLAQVAQWLAPTGTYRGDGIPFVEKEYGSTGRFAVGRTLADPTLGERFADIEHDRVMGAPLVVIMATRDDDEIDWLDCGQALEAVLLRATALGLSAAYVDQLLEYEDLHAAVHQMIGGDGDLVPHMALRLGYAPPLDRPAPRRDLDEVFDEED
ncbi:MAG: nitroreductase family protein [Deltaproteobacteria bacterium]|nr:nitroreductase family protein [Deltaproteobacteria bacterium]